jgi:hypothetical protein
MNGEEGEGGEHWLTVWESTVASELEGRTDLDIDGEKSAVGQKLWLTFQNTATAIAQVPSPKLYVRVLAVLREARARGLKVRHYSRNGLWTRSYFI